MSLPRKETRAVLLARMGVPELQLPSDWIFRFRHLVYAWLRGDEVLYVGKSDTGLGRPLTSAHHLQADGGLNVKRSESHE